MAREANGRYLVEVYVPAEDAGALPAAASRMQAAAEQMARRGAPVRLLRTILALEDEVWFCLLEAPCAEAAVDTARRAGLVHQRVQPALAINPGTR